jgi:hypothetical protein
LPHLPQSGSVQQALAADGPLRVPPLNRNDVKLREERRTMSLKQRWFSDKLKKKAAKGLVGYPVATVAFYGPDEHVDLGVTI